jgi:integrase/recombinase XerD
LSKEEVAKILSSINNLKYKALVMLLFSSGLRVGKVIKLETEHIDSQRMLVFIKVDLKNLEIILETVAPSLFSKIA